MFTNYNFYWPEPSGKQAKQKDQKRQKLFYINYYK